MARDKRVGLESTVMQSATINASMNRLQAAVVAAVTYDVNIMMIISSGNIAANGSFLFMFVVSG